MKKTFLVLLILTLVFGFSLQTFAQFTKEEVAEREKWEEFIQNAEIVAEDLHRGGSRIWSRL